MLRYALTAVFLIAFAIGALDAADEPVWGTPADGLRIGITPRLTGKGPLTADVVYMNVGEQEIVIPETFPRQAILRCSALAVRKTAKGLELVPIEGSVCALTQERIGAAIALPPRTSFVCALPPSLRCEPLQAVSLRCTFRAEAPDDQPDANGWQDIAESGTVELRRTRAGWAVSSDANGKDVPRDDWASNDEIWVEFLARKGELVALLKEGDWSLSRQAAGALALMGAYAADAASDIAALLEREDPTEDGACHLEVVEALGQLAPDAPPAATTLTKALQDTSEGQRKVRLAAIRALGRLPASPDLLRTLIGALKDPWSAVRCEAAFALGKLGPAAREALPALQETAKDPLGVVHEGALDAIQRIEAK